MKNMWTLPNKIVISLILVIVLLFSVTKCTGYMSNPDFYPNTIDRLDGNINTVTKLAVSASAASALISFLPDDACTPIAQEIAELGKYFLVILSALYFEKYFITVAGYGAFGVLIPIAILAIILAMFWKKEVFAPLACKILIFAILFWGIIPLSTKVSDLIYETYESSISETLLQASEIIDEENTSTGIVDKMIGAVGSAIEYVSTLLSGFLEALAIMIVVSCIIPIIVIVFMIYIIKMLFGIKIPITQKNA